MANKQLCVLQALCGAMRNGENVRRRTMIVLLLFWRVVSTSQHFGEIGKMYMGDGLNDGGESWRGHLFHEAAQKRGSRTYAENGFDWRRIKIVTWPFRDYYMC